MLTAIIPVNRLNRAKGRLDGLLRPRERRELALTTLATVIEAALGAGLRPTVLTADPDVAAAIAGRAELFAEDPARNGLNPQLEAAVAGREEVLVLHADLPLASAAALSTFVEAALPAPSATLVRSRDGGTNAMFLRPPGCFALAYGPDSHAKHVAAATAAGVAVRTIAIPALELDLDTPADVAAFMEHPEAPGTRAGKLLARWAVVSRL